jgi:hypothetical protein
VIRDLYSKLEPGQRYLLFIHGIFSSIKGAFGELALARWDDYLLSDLGKKYHKIIGFDHWTVANSTLDNARDLVKMLPKDCDIDIVCHSRGGAVTRCLLEHPEIAKKVSRKGLRFNKAIFVAGACQGSDLAHPDNIGRLVNAFSAISSITGGYFPVTIAAGLLRFAQYGVNEFPGIAAMNPESPIFRQLNKASHHHGCQYIFARSDFEPRGRLLEMLDEIGIDKFVFKGQRNDGVVPYEGAGQFDPDIHGAGLVTEGPQFEPHQHVFHTGFFKTREIRAMLRDQLLD